MNKLVIRHGLSEANNRDNRGTPAFGSASAPLMAQGWEMAHDAGVFLRAHYNIEPAREVVATSTMLRTQQTALGAGCRPERIITYACLDEVSDQRERAELRVMIDTGVVPPEAIEAAIRVLDAPPAEDIWFTHGLVIAGLSKVLGQHQDKRMIPRFCEVRQLFI